MRFKKFSPVNKCFQSCAIFKWLNDLFGVWLFFSIDFCKRVITKIELGFIIEKKVGNFFSLAFFNSMNSSTKSNRCGFIWFISTFAKINLINFAFGLATQKLQTFHFDRSLTAYHWLCQNMCSSVFFSYVAFK